MAHHVGTEEISKTWSRVSNDLIHRICTLLPDNFVPVGQLPQFPGVSPKNCIEELQRLVDLGFVGVNLNPDPAGGYWTDPPLTDKWWYPLYEKMAELEMTAMIHVTSSCNPAFHRYSPEARYCAAVAASGFSTKRCTRRTSASPAAAWM